MRREKYYVFSISSVKSLILANHETQWVHGKLVLIMNISSTGIVCLIIQFVMNCIQQKAFLPATLVRVEDSRAVETLAALGIIDEVIWSSHLASSPYLAAAAAPLWCLSTGYGWDRRMGGISDRSKESSCWCSSSTIVPACTRTTSTHTYTHSHTYTLAHTHSSTHTHIFPGSFFSISHFLIIVCLLLISCPPQSLSTNPSPSPFRVLSAGRQAAAAAAAAPGRNYFWPLTDRALELTLEPRSEWRAPAGMWATLSDGRRMKKWTCAPMARPTGSLSLSLKQRIKAKNKLSNMTYLHFKRNL